LLVPPKTTVYRQKYTTTKRKPPLLYPGQMRSLDKFSVSWRTASAANSISGLKIRTIRPKANASLIRRGVSLTFCSAFPTKAYYPRNWGPLYVIFINEKPYAKHIICELICAPCPIACIVQEENNGAYSSPHGVSSR